MVKIRSGFRQGCCTRRSRSVGTCRELRRLGPDLALRPHRNSCNFSRCACSFDSAAGHFWQAPQGRRGVCASAHLLACLMLACEQGRIRVRQHLLVHRGGVGTSSWLERRLSNRRRGTPYLWDDGRKLPPFLHNQYCPRPRSHRRKDAEQSKHIKISLYLLLESSPARGTAFLFHRRMPTWPTPRP